MSFTDGFRAFLGSSDNGNRVVKKDKYSRYSWLIFSDEDYEGYKRFAALKSAALAIVVIILSLVVYLIASGTGNSAKDLETLLARGDTDKEAELDLTLEYQGHTVEEELSLTVLPKQVDEKAAQILFDEADQWLSEILSEKLQFPDQAPNGVDIIWENSDFTYLGIDEPIEKAFIAQLSFGEYVRLSEFMVHIEPDEENYMESLNLLATELQETLSLDDSGDSLVLPDTRNGADLLWSVREKEAPTAIIAAGVFLAFMIILGRRNNEKKQLENRLEQFEHELPDLSFQLVLYLNAGLVVENALSRIISQSEGDLSPLYRALRDVKARADAANNTLINEIYSFARNTGSQDFIRLATLCYEHSSKGSELSEKLEEERLHIQGGRLMNAKSRIKAAETRLCFPLMLLLVVLILITVVPSFLQCSL